MGFVQQALKGQEAAAAPKSMLDPTGLTQAAWPYPKLLVALPSLLHAHALVS